MKDKIISFSKETVDGETVTKTSIVRRNNDGSWSGSYIINNGEPQSMGSSEPGISDLLSLLLGGPKTPPQSSSLLDLILGGQSNSPTPVFRTTSTGPHPRSGPPRTTSTKRSDPFAGMLNW